MSSSKARAASKGWRRRWPSRTAFTCGGTEPRHPSREPLHAAKPTERGMEHELGVMAPIGNAVLVHDGEVRLRMGDADKRHAALFAVRQSHASQVTTDHQGVVDRIRNEHDESQRQYQPSA